MFSCATAIAPVYKPLTDFDSAAENGGTKKSRIEFLFYDRSELDPVEGGWTFLASGYEVAILRAGDEYGCDYLGVMVADNPSTWWRAGQIKLELTKTSVAGLYTGVYRMGDKTKRSAAFRLSEGGDLLEMSWAIQTLREDGDVTAVRSYPVELSEADDGGKQGSTGTGFFASGGGLVLTAYHVVEDCSEIVVVDSSGIEHPAELLRYSKANDLAVLQTAASEREFLRLGTVGDLRVGGKIFTMGYPASGILGREVKYSDGAVASTSGVEGEQSLFQMTIPIQPGNSGGAVVNEEGSVLGIVTSSAAILPFLRSTGSLPQNVNWAVKAEYARLLLGEASGEDRSTNSDPVDLVKRATCLIRAK